MISGPGARGCGSRNRKLLSNCKSQPAPCKIGNKAGANRRHSPFGSCATLSRNSDSASVPRAFGANPREHSNRVSSSHPLSFWGSLRDAVRVCHQTAPPTPEEAFRANLRSKPTGPFFSSIAFPGSFRLYAIGVCHVMAPFSAGVFGAIFDHNQPGLSSHPLAFRAPFGCTPCFGLDQKQDRILPGHGRQRGALKR